MGCEGSGAVGGVQVSTRTVCVEKRRRLLLAPALILAEDTHVLLRDNPRNRAAVVLFIIESDVWVIVVFTGELDVLLLDRGSFDSSI